MSDFTMNTDAYLARLGLEGPMAPTADNLKRLTRAHLIRIPFENLELYAEHREPSMTEEGLFTKIITNRRGGYCFELNRIYYLLLQALGYECYCVAARVVHRKQEPRYISHRAIVVIADGYKWYVDVGFGGAGPKGALRMDTEEVQTVFGDSFRIVPDGKDHVILRLEAGAEERVMVYRDEPWLDVDFEILNGYFARHPNSVFRNKRILYRCTEDGWVSLTENSFTTFAGGAAITEEVEEDRIEELLQTQFTLCVPCHRYTQEF